MSKNEHIELSVVVPVFNEEGNVELLFNKIKDVMLQIGKTFEIIFIDDGSKDTTFEIMERLHSEGEPLIAIKFRGNFGQSAAMAAGFDAAKGDVIITMDGDLQNDPVDIPNMLQKLDEGYDVISGWRKYRKDKLFIRKVPSKIANRLICSVTGVYLHDTGCALKLYRKSIVKRIRLYGELHRFLPALAKIEGAQIAEMAVNHHARQFGVSKYNLTRTFRVIMDLSSLNLFIKHLKNPLRFFGKIGAFMFGLTFLMILWILYHAASSPTFEQVNILSILVFLFAALGFQFFLFGFLASLLVHTGEKKNLYLVDTPVNKGDN